MNFLGMDALESSPWQHRPEHSRPQVVSGEYLTSELSPSVVISAKEGTAAAEA